MENFYRRFLQSVEKWPHNIAVELRHAEAARISPLLQTAVQVDRYTYAELRRMAESVGQWLLANNMPRGARCAILAANGPRWVAAYLGIIATGGVAVPLDTDFNSSQLAKLLRDSGSGCLFTDSKRLEIARQASMELNILLVLLDVNPDSLPTFDSIMAAGPGSFTPANLAPTDPAVILYTSGTTSDPKGVLLAHDNLLAEIDAVFPVIEISDRDSVLGVLPLFHALAQMANLLLPFAAGARVVYLESLNVTDLMQALGESGVTVFVCVPQFFYLIHERMVKQMKTRGRVGRAALRLLVRISGAGRTLGLNLGKIFFRKAHEALGPNIRLLISGGSHFDPAIGRDLRAMGFEILQAYGLTETSGGATVTHPGHNVIASVGPPLHGVEVKIDRSVRQEDGRSDGEIVIRGRIIMQGYWKRPDATAEVLRDGWLHTGDLGYIDDDGNLFVTGRRRDVIVLSSGKNIYPEELEAHYLKTPFIKEICVLGLESRPGEPFAERLHGVIVPNYQLLRERRIVNAKDVIRFDIEGLSAQLPSSKRILSYELWQTELPRSSTRKLKRHEIRERVLAGKHNGNAAAASSERELTQEEISWLEQPDVASTMVVIRHLSKNGRNISPSHSLELDLGLDSMERVELLLQLEHELGASVQDSVASEVYTVREMVDAVRAAAGSDHKPAEFAGWESLLAQESTNPDVLAIGRSRRLAMAFWFVAGQLLNLLCRDLGHLEVEGLDKLPGNGPFILSPNHQSLLDAPVVWALFPWQLFKNTFHLGTSEIWGWGWRRRVARSLNLIPVDPDSNLLAGMRAGAYGLKRGKVLVMYPEGERSIDGVPKVFKKGAAILATHLRVAIYPVAIDGFYETWPRGKAPQKFASLRVKIGDPIMPPVSPGPDPEATYKRLTAELRARVVEMWQEIHGDARNRSAVIGSGAQERP